MATAQKRAAERWRYVLDVDKALPEEQQSGFILTPLSQLERAEARDNFARRVVARSGETTVSKRDSRMCVEFCATHIAEVENFPVGAPKPWPAMPEERYRYLEQLDDAWVQELGNEIWVRSELGDDIKNS